MSDTATLPLRPPDVTVERWTLRKLKDGEEFIFSDSNNPTLGYEARVWIEGGIMYASLTNSRGFAQTRATREVRPVPAPPITLADVEALAEHARNVYTHLRARLALSRLESQDDTDARIAAEDELTKIYDALATLQAKAALAGG